MLAINLNSKILNPATPEPPVSIRMLRAMGRDAYRFGRPYSEMVTTPEREGWMAALNAEADAQTEMYLEAHRG